MVFEVSSCIENPNAEYVTTKEKMTIKENPLLQQCILKRDLL